MNKVYLYICLLLVPLTTSSQVVNDAKLWSSVTLNKKIEDFKLSYSQEFRLDENFSHVDKFFSEVGLDYKIVKNFSTSFGYRFARENDYENFNYEINHRFDFGLEYQYEIEDWQIEYRIKYQTKTASPTENNPSYLRNKFTLDYKKDDFSPYISYELFYQFNEERVLNRSRISLGAKLDITKKSAIKCFYTFENRFNTNNLEHNHIYGIGYSIDL